MPGLEKCPKMKRIALSGVGMPLEFIDMEQALLVVLLPSLDK
jgi:hypothetical protein